MRHHYNNMYLYFHNGVGCDSNTYVKTSYGYKIKRMTNFIAIYRTKLYIYADGSAKAVTKASKNYCADWQYTYYFDKRGFRIDAETTRKELAIWKKGRLRKVTK